MQILFMDQYQNIILLFLLKKKKEVNHYKSSSRENGKKVSFWKCSVNLNTLRTLLSLITLVFKL